MECPACKKENANNNKFCNHCGYNLGGGDTGGLGPSAFPGRPADASNANADTLPLAGSGAGTPPPNQPYGPNASQPGNYAANTPVRNNASGSRPGKNKLTIGIACVCLILIAGAIYFYKFMDRGDQFVCTWQKVGGSSVAVISKTNNGYNFHDYDGDHNASYSGGKLMVTFREGQATATLEDDQMILAMYGMSETYKRRAPVTGSNGDQVASRQETPEGKVQNDAGDKDKAYATISGKTISAHVGEDSVAGQVCQWDRVIASSTLAPQGSSSYEPEKALDRNNSTAWVEGSSDAGENEWIELQSDTPQKISAIQINNGYDKSNNIFLANNRAEEIRIDFSDGSYIYSTLLDGYGVISQIDLGRAIKTSRLRITILGAYPGTQYNDTCISEVQAF